ncbi:unnamed protein product [Linum tenue]|uniref:Uncharacterized protein n=1 Tax=Linum tenue TaxID=586396 RepID=A0AAV0NBK5_9ROSI|nr:unnamed protein product [Linum tenue]
MAGTEQEQLLALIRDCVSEKSQGERRLIGSKKRDQDLHSELEIVNAEVDQAKRFKESAEQKLKGYEIELSMLDASVQTMQSRNSLLQNQISAAGSELEKLKVTEPKCELRPRLMRASCRNFHQMVSSETAAGDHLHICESMGWPWNLKFFRSYALEFCPSLSLISSLFSVHKLGDCGS